MFGHKTRVIERLQKGARKWRDTEWGLKAKLRRFEVPAAEAKKAKSLKHLLSLYEGPKGRGKRSDAQLEDISNAFDAHVASCETLKTLRAVLITRYCPSYYDSRGW